MKTQKSGRLRLSLLTVVLSGIALMIALPFAAQQRGPVSSIPPLKPNSPDGPLSAGERLIPLPANHSSQNNRSRRVAATSQSLPSLNEEQKILHLLNRTGYGPRPGDIERIRKMGLDRYLDQQLHPENLSDEFITPALLRLNTLQMAITETVQFFAPQLVRPAPTPTPTPPAPVVKPLPTLAERRETGDDQKKGEMAAAQNQQNPGESMAAPPSNTPPQPNLTPQAMPQITPGQMPAPSISPTNPESKPSPTPSPRRDPQQPLRELQQAKLLRAVFSEKQLQEVMVDFWINHFNIFAGKDNARWMITSYERDVIRPHSLGNFKELLVAVAQSPAMLYYLDNFLSQAEPRVMKEVENVKAGEIGKTDSTSDTPPPSPSPIPPPRRPGLNENYARELMELHTLGVDGGYTQQDVIDVARAFTGWSITPPPTYTFYFRPRVHDKDEKNVLGMRITAGGGIEDGLRVLDQLTRHPSTARFISHKLCQRFVADNPPAALVARAAETFKRTGGEIREVVRTILTSPEFYSTKNYRNKIKSPLELTASAIRATGASTDGFLPLIQWVSRMGEPLYLCQPPTGYSEDSSRWLSNATLLERMNFALALIENKIPGTRVSASRLLTPDAAKDRDELLDQMIVAIIHSDISDETRDHLARVFNDFNGKLVPAAYNAKSVGKNRELLVNGIAALVLGSREFQVK